MQPDLKFEGLELKMFITNTYKLLLLVDSFLKFAYKCFKYACVFKKNFAYSSFKFAYKVKEANFAH